MKSPLVIYWSRRDFRLTDNPALTAAIEKSKNSGVPFLPLFILEDYQIEASPANQFGYPSRWFLANAIPKFASLFERFLLVSDKAASYLISLQNNYDLTIFVNEDIYVDFYKQIEKLQAAGVSIEVCADALSVDKDTRSGEGNLYSVFTPFKKSVWVKFINKRPLPKVDLHSVTYLAKDQLAKLPNQIEINVDNLWRLCSKNRLISYERDVLNLDDLVEKPELTGWYLSEAEALACFTSFLESGTLDQYSVNRDSLELDAEPAINKKQPYGGKTSKMSLALAWGLVSARTLVALIQKHFDEPFDNPFSARVSAGALIYISELIWREFYRYQFFHHPELMNTEFQKRFRGTIKWVEGDTARDRFIAWIKGETGYPVVDAAMKQIAKTGWMHNRARMVVASILTKNLGVDWRHGQEYFRATLIDLDESSNNGGWQWGASVGADPKPIRIFNPDLQAKNYDASGAYQELWLGGNDILKATTVPIIEHKMAREEALTRYGLKEVEPRDY